MYSRVFQYFCRLYSIISYDKIMAINPCAMQYILVVYLFVYIDISYVYRHVCLLSYMFMYVFIHNSLYLLIPCTSCAPPFYLSPLVNTSCFLYLWVCFCFAYTFICIIFLDFIYKWYPTVFVFLSLSLNNNFLEFTSIKSTPLKCLIQCLFRIFIRLFNHH